MILLKLKLGVVGLFGIYDWLNFMDVIDYYDWDNGLFSIVLNIVYNLDFFEESKIPEGFVLYRYACFWVVLIISDIFIR